MSSLDDFIAPDSVDQLLDDIKRRIAAQPDFPNLMLMPLAGEALKELRALRARDRRVRELARRHEQTKARADDVRRRLRALRTVVAEFEREVAEIDARPEGQRDEGRRFQLRVSLDCIEGGGIAPGLVPRALDRRLRELGFEPLPGEPDIWQNQFRPAPLMNQRLGELESELGRLVEHVLGEIRSHKREGGSGEKRSISPTTTSAS
jgi:hypothetical protein